MFLRTFGEYWPCFICILGSFSGFKGGPSDLGTKILQTTKKSSLYSQSLLIFIHRTPVVENHPTTREIRELLWPLVDKDGNHSLLLHEQLAHLPTGNTQKKVSNIASDEDMENNYMFMLWNLSVISPTMLISISGAKSKNNLRGHVAF